MLYHIDDEPDSTVPNPGTGTGDLTAVGVASVANAAAAAVVASATATDGDTKKDFIKAGTTKTNDSSLIIPPEQIKPEVNKSYLIISKLN